MGRRALIYLKKKYKRSVLLFLLLFVISFSLAVGITVWNSIGAVTKEVQRQLGTSFNFRLPSAVTNNEYFYEDVVDVDGNPQKLYVGPKLNEETIAQILAEVPGISEYNAEIDEYVYLDDAQMILGIGSLGAEHTDPVLNEWLRLYDHVTILYGNSSAKMYSYFRMGLFSLVDGRYVEADDQYKIMVSDEFLKQNDLHIGDSISLSLRAGMSGICENVYEMRGEPLKVEIIGVFHFNGYYPMMEWTSEQDLAYNWLLSDIATVDYFKQINNVLLYGGKEQDLRYRNVTFFVDDPAQLDSIMDDVENIESFDTTYYEISVDDTMYKSTVEPLKSIRNIIAGVVGVIVAGCFIVLCVVFTMWVRSRRQEIAIYLSLGISKFKIIGQFVLEASIVALAALVLTFATCQQVPDLIGNSMLASTIEAAQPEEKEYSWEEIGQAAMSGTTSELFQYESSTYAGPESIDFSFGFVQLLVLAVLELLIIIAAICKGGSFIFKLQPRQILITLR